MSTVNYLTARSSNLAAFNTIQLNVSTLTGSTIQTTATANTSSIIVSTLTTRSATYSTLTGSTITTNSLALSTLMVSSINNGAPGVAAYSTLNVSSMNASSSITTSSITTSVIATTTGFTTIGQNTSFPNRSIEIGSDAANTVYFDFHSSDSVYADYSTRIQSNGGSTTGQGHMMLQGSTINILGTSGVGIGTANPPNAFHVYGASAPAIGMGNSTAANFFQIGAASFSGSYSSSAVAGDAVIRTTSGNLMLQTGLGAAAMYVNTSNNIILNYNTSSPSTYKLCVEQGLNNNNGILISNSNYGSPQQFQLSMVNAGSGNFYSYAMIQTNTGGVAATVPLCLQPNSANVGIGTTAPTGKCHIYGSANGSTSDSYSLNVSSADSFNGDGGSIIYSSSINLKAGDLVWAGGAIRVYGARIYIGGGYSNYAAQNQGYVAMYTGNTERVRISDAGNVGIGLVSPSYKLHVYGSMCLDRGAATYSSTLAATTYAAGTWYTMFSPNSLTVNAGTYLISMTWQQTAPPYNPYNLSTSFLFYNQSSNDNNASQLSGAAVPTTYHASNGAGDWQLFIRSQSQGSAYVGLQWKCNSALPSGYWTVWAHLISA